MFTHSLNIEKEVIKTYSRITAGIAAAVIAFAFAGVQVAAADSGNDDSDGSADTTGQEVRFGPTLEDSVLLGIAGENPETSTDTAMRSIPFDPVDVVQCNLSNNADHVLYTIDTFAWQDGTPAGNVWPGGDVDLLCGTDTTSGFKHIRDRHQFPSLNAINSWETVRASATSALGYESPQSWDEYMIHAIEDTVDWAHPWPKVNQAEQKICFSAPFNIWKDGQIYASYYANTIISKSNFTVITAFLSNNSQASACYDGW